MTKKIVFILLLAFFAIFADAHKPPRNAPRSFCGKRDVGCILFPDVTEGPYYYEDLWVRKNITEGHGGVKLTLILTVMNTDTCELATNAAVDLWHCNATGIYSHYVGKSNGDSSAAADNTTFLRGIQLTDSNGQATFDTIFPGWYAGRTVHMHMKVHIGGNVTWKSSDSTYRYAGGETTLTGQLFFNESMTATVAKVYPYTLHSGVSRMTNSEDGIYNGGGYYGMTTIQYADPSAGLSGGLVATVTVGVSLSGDGSTPTSSTPTSSTPTSSTPTSSTPTSSTPSGSPPSGTRPSGSPPNSTTPTNSSTPTTSTNSTQSAISGAGRLSAGLFLGLAAVFGAFFFRM